MVYFGGGMKVGAGIYVAVKWSGAVECRFEVLSANSIAAPD